MSSNSTVTCIGRYCGYPPDVDTGGWSKDKCGACPWGHRSNDTNFCIKCDDRPEVYDWLFLGFMGLLPCMLHWFSIIRDKNGTKLIVIQLLLSSIECICAALLAILSTEPRGRVELVSCGVQRLSDWYPMFYNPEVRYTETIHCTQEAVYPLLTIVCIYYAYTLVLMMILRPAIMSIFAPHKLWRDPIYAGLYFHPVLVVLQAFAGGLLYYAFPYIMVLLSIIALASYFVLSNVTDIKALFWLHCMDNFLVILWHSLLLGYGIVGIVAVSGGFYFLFSVPLPTLFYFLTIHFTAPDAIATEMR